MGKVKKKKVYLIGNDDKQLVAYANSKEEAKGYVKQYPNSNLMIAKTKLTPKLEQHLNDDILIYTYVLTPDNKKPLYVTYDEETYFYESFTQFKRDVEYTLRSFKENISYLNLTEKEYQYVKLLPKLIFNVFRVEEKYCEGGNDEFDIYNFYEALRYFINNTLGGKV